MGIIPVFKMEILNYERLAGKTVSIVGLSKNSGKTTTLNAIISQAYRHFSRIGITSIGRDGEKQDVATGNAKPQIFASDNMIVATTAELIDYCDASKRIIYSTDFNTPMGRVYLFQTLSGGYIQIGGPSSVSQMIEIKNIMRKFGCDCIFIDGAASRRSFGFSKLADGIVLCTSANISSNMNEAVEKTSYIVSLYDLPICLDDDGLFVKGAITDSIIEKILLSYTKNELKCLKLIFEDPAKVICSYDHFTRLKSAVNTIEVYGKPELLAISVNPTSVYGWSFDSEKFVEKLKDKVSVPVFDVAMEC